MFRTATRNSRWIIFVSLLFLLVMTLARLVLFFVFKTQGDSVSHTLPAFWLGIRYDLRETGIVAVLMLLLGTIKPIRPFATTAGKKLWMTLLMVYTFLLVTFYAIDFAHFDYLHQRLNASALNFLQQDAQTSLGMVVQTYPVFSIVLGILVATLIIMFIIRVGYRRIERQPNDRVTKTSMWIWGVALFVLYGGAVFGHIGQYPLRWCDAFTLGDEHLSQVALNPVQSFFSSLSFRHDSYDSRKVHAAYPAMAAYLGVDRPDSVKLNYERAVSKDSSGAPNVIVVICESFSGYKSSMWGNPLNTTPYFNELCTQGIFFDHCFTPHFGTARGVWATITGIPDVLLDKTASRNPSMVDQHTIINDIAGYEKYYFIGGSTSWANMRALLQNNIKGLHLYEQDKYDAPKVDVWGISDKNLFLQANKVLAQQRKPFFAVIQTSDNHRPYTIPKEDRDAFKRVTYSDDELHKYGFQHNDELNAFRYTDFCFQQFIEAAKKEGYFKNTVFVFVGDHGIRGDAADMFPRAWTDYGLTCFHVPLLFYSPALLAPARHSMNCSQVDIMPTVAGIIKKPYRNTTLGRDLLHLNDTTKNISFVIDHDVHRIGVVRGDYYYTRQLASGKEALMSIRNNDPVPATIADSLNKTLRTLTDDFYETSRYMLMNNKKK